VHALAKFGRLVVGEERDRGIPRPYRPVFGPRVAVEERVASRPAGADRRAAVAEREDRHLLALEELSTTTWPPKRLRPLPCLVGSACVVADGDALSRGEPVGLDYARRPCLVEVSARGNGPPPA
jgi:hypothetical protein